MYIDFILKILCKIYYNMFGSVLVGSVYSNLKPKPNRNFRFLKLKIKTKLNRNFGNGSVGFGPFFGLSVFCTPLILTLSSLATRAKTS